jgi:tetratricopeptide (TPR) repeat protein
LVISYLQCHFPLPPLPLSRYHDLLVLIVEWSLLHYYTADIPAMNRLMREHADLLERVPDPELRGMWLTWHCFVGYCMLNLPESIAFSDRAIEIGEETKSCRVLAYAYTQRAWALNYMGRNSEFVTFAEKALALVDQLADERDARYIRLKAGCGAAIGRLGIGDLIKSRAAAKDLMDFASVSDSARALSVAHAAIGVIHAFTGDLDRGVAEMARARDIAPDPIYRGVAEQNLSGFLVGSGELEAARGVIEPSLRFGEERGMLALVIPQRINEAVLLLGEGDLTKGMDQLEAVKREAGKLQSQNIETSAAMSEATVYARIATGEAKGSIGVIVRNPGFALGRARKASQTARDSLSQLSENLPPDLEGFRFMIEFEFAKLLIKRKERDEARKHLEKAIAFLQPAGDSVGMRDARALLATLDAK